MLQTSCHHLNFQGDSIHIPQRSAAVVARRFGKVVSYPRVDGGLSGLRAKRESLMKAMVLPRIVSLQDTKSPLKWTELPTPQPAPHEILVRVRACGVCHTELDEIEGRTAPPRLPVVPGHEVVGTVERCGTAVRGWREGDRVGVGWIHSSSGGSLENLDPQFRATGRDVDGGYAEYLTVPADYAYPIPACFSDVEAAPLLCAGAIGYRASAWHTSRTATCWD